MENLDIKKKEIRRRLEDCYGIIKVAQDEITRLRDECDHTQTKIVDYEIRPGRIVKGVKICGICEKVLKR